MITQAQLAVSTDVRQRALLTCQPVKQLVPESNQVVVDRVAFVGVAAVVAHGKNIYILYYFINQLQCARTDLNKRFLPKPMTTTG